MHTMAKNVIKIVLLWNVTPYSVVQIYPHYRGTCYISSTLSQSPEQDTQISLIV
jgi:hypothetical protein